MSELAERREEGRVMGALVAGALLVLAYSVVGARFKLYLLHQQLGPRSPEPTMRDLVQLALAGKFVQDLLQGPIAWIVGSGLVWCGLSILDQKRPVRRVLAATGIPFAAPTVALASLYLALVRHPRLVEVVSIEVLGAWVGIVGMLAALVWIVIRLRALDVEVGRGGLAVAFAAALFALGKWLPALLAR